MIFNIWQYYSAEGLTSDKFEDIPSHFNLEIFCTLLFYVEHIESTFLPCEWNTNLEADGMHNPLWWCWLSIEERVSTKISFAFTKSGHQLNWNTGNKKCFKFLCKAFEPFSPFKSFTSNLFSLAKVPPRCFWSFQARRSCLYLPPVEICQSNAFG